MIKAFTVRDAVIEYVSCCGIGQKIIGDDISTEIAEDIRNEIENIEYWNEKLCYNDSFQKCTPARWNNAIIPAIRALVFEYLRRVHPDSVYVEFFMPINSTINHP